MARNSVARAASCARSKSISERLAKPNAWAEWLPEKEIGPMSWAHLAALLLRRLTPERAIEVLAPVLEHARQSVEQQFEEDLRDDPHSDDWPIPYMGYHIAFLEHCDRRIGTALAALDGNDDIRWFARQVGERSPHEPALLWFLLGGIAQACFKGELDRSRIDERARWLAEIRWAWPEDCSALECLVEELYDAFQERHPDHVEKRSEADQQFADMSDPFGPAR